MRTNRTLTRRGRQGTIGVPAGVALVVALAVPAFAYSAAATHTVSVGPRASATSTATCPAGKRVVFGGIAGKVTLPVFTANIVFPQDMHMDATGAKWVVRGFNGWFTGAGQLTSRAYCSVAAKPSVVAVTAPVGPRTSGLGKIGTATATCPAGKVLVAGGFGTPTAAANPAGPTTPRSLVTAAHRVTGNTRAWKVTILNVINTPTTVTARAYCAAGPAPTEKITTVAVPPNGPALTSASATCPAPKRLLFGGFVGTYGAGLGFTNPGVTMFGLRAESTTKWTVAAWNSSGFTAGTIKSIAYCR